MTVTPTAGTATTTDFAYDGQSMVRELRGVVPYATYFHGPRGPEYRRDDGTGQVRWYLYDGRWSGCSPGCSARGLKMLPAKIWAAGEEYSPDADLPSDPATCRGTASAASASTRPVPVVLSPA